MLQPSPNENVSACKLCSHSTVWWWINFGQQANFRDSSEPGQNPFYPPDLTERSAQTVSVLSFTLTSVSWKVYHYYLSNSKSLTWCLNLCIHGILWVLDLWLRFERGNQMWIPPLSLTHRARSGQCLITYDWVIVCVCAVGSYVHTDIHVLTTATHLTKPEAVYRYAIFNSQVRI